MRVTETDIRAIVQDALERHAYVYDGRTQRSFCKCGHLYRDHWRYQHTIVGSLDRAVAQHQAAAVAEAVALLVREPDEMGG